MLLFLLKKKNISKGNLVQFHFLTGTQVLLYSKTSAESSIKDDCSEDIKATSVELKELHEKSYTRPLSYNCPVAAAAQEHRNSRERESR